MRTEIVNRWVAAARANGLDAMLSCSPENFAYLTGFVVPSQPLMRHRHAMALGDGDHRADLVGPADVAGIDADAVRTGLDRLDRKRVVEVDVGDDRDRRQADDLGERLRVLGLGHGAAHDLAARRGERGDLGGGRLDVVRLRERHRLDDDGRTAADRHAADRDLPLARHWERS